MNYIKMPTRRHQKSQEINPIPVDESARQVDKKVKRKRVKSPFRDASFRPLFQSLEDIEELQASVGASVIEAPPLTSHPSQSDSPSHINPDTRSGAYVAEHLPNADEARHARFWRAFSASTSRQYRTPAEWRDLSDEYAIEWFHHALRAGGPVSAFTLQLDDDVEAQIRREPKSADWLYRRIARRLKVALGRPVLFWFTLEVSPGSKRRVHVHGELQAAPDDLPAVRKALRAAGGEWKDTRQHQAHTREEPSVVWSNYAASDAYMTRPLSGRFANIPRPINGDWYCASKPVRALAEKLYSSRRELVISFMRSMPRAG